MLQIMNGVSKGRPAVASCGHFLGLRAMQLLLLICGIGPKGLYWSTCSLTAKLVFWKYLGRSCISRGQPQCKLKKITRLVK